MKKKELKPGSVDGRPPVTIDWGMFDTLCRIHCTQEEIASVMKVDVDTIGNHAQKEFGLSFSELWLQKKGDGKMSLRRMQWQAAQGGNVVMMIWLGKQYLGQSDKADVTSDGKAIGEVRWSFADSRNGHTQTEPASVN